MSRASGCCAVVLLSLALPMAAVRADVGKLVVTDSRGEVVLGFPVEPGERWCLLWNHSVAGFTVSDCFVHRPPDMVLERSHQPDFAAGLGHYAGRGQLSSDGSGGYWIERIDEPVKGNSLALRIGSVAVNHRLVHRGREISISRLMAGQRATLRLLPHHPQKCLSVRGEADSDE